MIAMMYPLILLIVQDYARWRPVFDEYAAARKASGSRGGQLFHTAENPNEVLVLWEWNDLASAREFFQSPGLRETMQKAGVTGRPDVVYLEEVEYVPV
jgi:heme-degrading monooxygenase HmoA